MAIIRANTSGGGSGGNLDGKKIDTTISSSYLSDQNGRAFCVDDNKITMVSYTAAQNNGTLDVRPFKSVTITHVQYFYSYFYSVSDMSQTSGGTYLGNTGYIDLSGVDYVRIYGDGAGGGTSQNIWVFELA